MRLYPLAVSLRLPFHLSPSLSLSSIMKCCVRSSPIHTCPPLHSLLETPVFVFDRVCVHRIRRRELFFTSLSLSLFLLRSTLPSSKHVKTIPTPSTRNDLISLICIFNRFSFFLFFLRLDRRKLLYSFKPDLYRTILVRTTRDG